MKNFVAIVVDSDMGSRSRVKQAAVANHVFKEVIFAQDPKEGMAKIIMGSVDVVFIANRFGREAVHEFVKLGKGTTQGEDSAYILVIPQSEEMQQIIASGVVEGVDGFLIEPFSADGVLETTHIAQRIKQENMEKRARTAAALYVKNARSQFGRLRYFKKLGRSTEQAAKELQAIATSVRGMSSANKEFYMNQLIDEFIATLPPASEYAGVSKRIKQRQDQKKEAEMKKIYE